MKKLTWADPSHRKAISGNLFPQNRGRFNNRKIVKLGRNACSSVALTIVRFCSYGDWKRAGLIWLKKDDVRFMFAQMDSMGITFVYLKIRKNQLIEHSIRISAYSSIHFCWKWPPNNPRDHKTATPWLIWVYSLRGISIAVNMALSRSLRPQLRAVQCSTLPSEW